MREGSLKEKFFKVTWHWAIGVFMALSFYFLARILNGRTFEINELPNLAHNSDPFFDTAFGLLGPTISIFIAWIEFKSVREQRDSGVLYMLCVTAGIASSLAFAF